ncbi:ATP-binding protein [Nucisporomicrobium flavum]|uniref:ATP-binding protein n=1 Tax=Nucisporomicrobium flavum TaxID=2785915 RepID=UPI0018F72BB2|nr:ATP-binding protein [Nucisporomicrobium flavum]
MNGPYLVVDSPRISCVTEPAQVVTQVVVRGRWDDRLRQETARVMRACVAEAPALLLIDLVGLTDPAGDSASTWRTVAQYAAEAGPPISVVVCAAGPAVRQRMSGLSGEHAVELADTVDAALAARPALDGGVHPQHMGLPAHPGASALARTMVTDACQAFRVAHLVHPARLIVSELVANAVQHTGTDMDVRVSLRGALLHLAVQDRSRHLPQMLDIDPRDREPLQAQGWGLRMVAATAAAWGAVPCLDGKVVWATLGTAAAVAS